jgi:hypothetical protein
MSNSLPREGRQTIACYNDARSMAANTFPMGMEDALRVLLQRHPVVTKTRLSCKMTVDHTLTFLRRITNCSQVPLPI